MALIVASVDLAYRECDGRRRIGRAAFRRGLLSSFHRVPERLELARVLTRVYPDASLV
jgi:hypothetical protein